MRGHFQPASMPAEDQCTEAARNYKKVIHNVIQITRNSIQATQNRWY